MTDLFSTDVKYVDWKYLTSKWWIAMNGNEVTMWYISLIVVRAKILDLIRLENVSRPARKPSIQQELPDYQITKSRSRFAIL